MCDIGGHVCRLMLRPYGTFPHPNVLGGFLAVTLPYLLFFILNGIKRRRRLIAYVFIPSFVFGICALIVTFGRSAWVAGVVGILLVVYNKFHTTNNGLYSKYRKAILLGALVLTVLGVYVVLKDLQGTESVVIRNELNSAAIKMIWENPLFGVGWGNFLTALPSYLTTRTIYFLQPVHNIYLLVISQLGIIGTLNLGICIMYYAKHLNIRYSINIVTLSVVLFLGLFDHYFLTLQQGQLMMSLVIGVFLASRDIRKSSTP
jgi:O-antigen ligase